MTPEWLRKRTNNQFLQKNHDIFSTLVSFAQIAAMSRPGLGHSGPRPRQDFEVTRPR